MRIEVITPQQARQLSQQGARLIDMREADEYAREHIPEAQLLPLSAIEQGQCVDGLCDQDTVIFHCQSGSRTHSNADKLLRAAAPAKVLLMDGGLIAWRGQGLAVIQDKRQPLPIMRQVQIAAGLLILCGVILGYALTPGFFLLSGFVGAGLTFAGISGHCGMARLLQIMPWNSR